MLTHAPRQLPAWLIFDVRQKMSARDYTEHQHDLPTLVGRRCFLTLATNSAKLHIDENKKGGTFLWIDPPWQFGRDGEIIEASASCPHHDEEDYQQKFSAWCARFSPVVDSSIEKIEASPDGSLWIFLRDRYAFYVPAKFIPDDPPSWYDHWYLRKEEPNKAPEPTPMSVTPRAPSSTSRAGHRRGSS